MNNKTTWYYCIDEETGCLYRVLHASNEQDAWKMFKEVQSETNKKLKPYKTYEEPWWVQGGLD